jgi:mRNA interferase RelE/StbE
MRNRILAALKELASSPENGEPLKPSRFTKLRMGDYRVIYEIDRQSKQVIVLFAGHRRNVYDDFSRLF